MGEAKRRQEQFRAIGSCVYCGKACEPTFDHVPPKGIFPKPRPSKLVTVPACKDCNETSGRLDDEKFKAALAMQVDPKTNENYGRLTESGLATLRKNQRLVRDLFSNSKTVWQEVDGGILLPSTLFHWSAKNHDDVVERITRGLYYHETKTPLINDRFGVDVSFFGGGDEQISDIARSLNMRTIGNRQFTYAFGIAEENPSYSVWLYEFYEAHYCGAHTYPKQSASEKRTQARNCAESPT